MSLIGLSDNMKKVLLLIDRYQTPYGYPYFITTIRALEKRGLVIHFYQSRYLPAYFITKKGRAIINLIQEESPKGPGPIKESDPWV